MTKDKILVVDDDPGLRQLLGERLEEVGYQVIKAEDGLAGVKEFFIQRPDLVLLDLVMPSLDGLEVCRRLRDISEVPIIILSVKGHELDKVRGLSAGADDYLSKPFSIPELLARVQAALRRARMPATLEKENEYSDGTVAIDFRRHTVYVRGHEVKISPLEYRMLALLVMHAGQVLTHEEILDQVWGRDYYSPENVKLYISYLRHKIEADVNNPELILTVRRVGYSYHKPVGGATPMRAPSIY
ncbi:MAG: response regulator transcription factor [Chloroflexi bacterium]|nr:response regulator transcription factor [Chloroflexota bacterium]